MAPVLPVGPVGPVAPSPMTALFQYNLSALSVTSEAAAPFGAVNETIAAVAVLTVIPGYMFIEDGNAGMPSTELTTTVPDVI